MANETNSSIRYSTIFLGQRINLYEVPLDIFNTLNGIYELQVNTLPSANKQLVGQIKKEHSLYNSQETPRMKKHNSLPPYVLSWFESTFTHYLNVNNFPITKAHINSIWVNEMEPHEYNPIHVHQGSLLTGLSSVMMLKIPKDMGPEIARADNPSRGALQLIGNCGGDFTKTDFSPSLKERSFYVFPYDMRHCVYPHNNPSAIRRTLAANMDVDYDAILGRQV